MLSIYLIIFPNVNDIVGNAYLCQQDKTIMQTEKTLKNFSSDVIKRDRKIRYKMGKIKFL